MIEKNGIIHLYMKDLKELCYNLELQYILKYLVFSFWGFLLIQIMVSHFPSLHEFKLYNRLYWNEGWLLEQSFYIKVL